MQPVVDSLIGSGKLPSTFAGRPVSYADHEAMKVIVVMSDGENTDRYSLKNNDKDGASPIWQNSLDKTFSLYDANRGQYYSESLRTWRSKPWGNGTSQSCSGKGWRKVCVDTPDPGTAKQLSYPEAWNSEGMKYFFSNLYAPAYGYSGYAYNSWLDTMTGDLSASQMDTNLSHICSATKNHGVIIYSIGFETTNRGAAALTDCATSPAYYFGVQGLQIATAFASIANNINRLRLIQ